MDSWCGLREKKFVRSGGGWGVFDAEHNSPDLACGITLILQAFRVRAFKIVTCSGSVPMLQKYFAPPLLPQYHPLLQMLYDQSFT